MATRDDTFTIVQISDLHCGTQFFLPNLLERAITEVNDLQPQIVICSGDLTTFGFKEEYALAKDYLDRIECECLVVIPGNHDSRNVGYVHFEDLFGDRNSVARVGGVTVVAVDSTDPDLDPAPPRQYAALLQRDRVLRHPRGRVAQVPVPRAGEDHPVRHRHARVREVHGADRGGGDVAAVTRAVVVIDGEHYAPVVRDAIAGLPYEVVGAWLAGGTEKLRGDAD